MELKQQCSFHLKIIKRQQIIPIQLVIQVSNNSLQFCVGGTFKHIIANVG
jgi:hypothetical protein